jgi:PTH1 family peptidyl-tRNA hydrolase
MREKSTSKIRVFVFLGNPGKEYEKTRHNAAWLAVRRLPFYDSLVWQEKFKGRYAVSPDKSILLMPQTFMNLSGDCVRACMSFFKIVPTGLAVIHDDIELPFGTVGFRLGGGLGGHNGLRSIHKSLGTPEFWRFRLGIGRPARGDAGAHVLGRFSQEEEPLLDAYLQKAAAILLECALSPEAGAANYGKVSIKE